MLNAEEAKKLVNTIDHEKVKEILLTTEKDVDVAVERGLKTCFVILDSFRPVDIKAANKMLTEKFSFRCTMPMVGVGIHVSWDR